MANANLAEIREMGRAAHGEKPQLAKHPVIRVQSVTFTTTHGVSDAFHGETNVLRLTFDAEGYYLVGENPIATTANGIRLPANTVEHIGVPSGYKISIISAS